MIENKIMLGDIIRNYILYGFLIILLGFYGVLAEEIHLNVGESTVFQDKNIILENVANTGTVRLSIDGILYTISGNETREAIEITVMDYHYVDNLADRWAVLNFEEGVEIPTTTTTIPEPTITIPQDALSVGKSTIVDGKTIILENVGSTGSAMVSVDDVLCTITESGACNNIKIDVIEFYYSDYLANRWAKLNFGTEIETTTTTITEENTTATEKPAATTILDTTTTTIYQPTCNDGCWLNDTCIPFGNRHEIDGTPSYCDIDGTIKPQKEMEESCMNDYECRSNDCSDDKCVSTYSLLEKIWEALKNIFSFRINKIVEVARKN